MAVPTTDIPNEKYIMKHTEIFLANILQMLKEIQDKIDKDPATQPIIPNPPAEYPKDEPIGRVQVI